MRLERAERAIIPAAGYGTRQLPASKNIPKELLPVFDRPCLQYVLDEALAAGIHQFGLVTQYGKSAVEDYLDIQPDLNQYLRSRGRTDQADMLDRLLDPLAVAFVRQKGPRGLGDAILTARALAGDGPFAVLLADDLVDQPRPLIDELIDLQSKLGGAVVALCPVDPSESRNYGMARVETTDDGLLRVLELVEKPAPEAAPSNLAVVGRYVLPPEIFPLLATLPPGLAGEVQLTDALSVLARRGQVHAVHVTGRRFDVGTPLGLLEASLHFAGKRPELRPQLRRMLRAFEEEIS